MITAIIQARMQSTRLPGKVLLEVNGKPLLSYMLERLRQAKTLEQIVIATTDDASSEPIVEWCVRNKVSYFQGDENDVLARYAGAAKKFSASIVARMTSDCPLMDPRVVDRVVTFYTQQKKSYDFVANTVPLPCIYPDGMDVEVFSAELLAQADREATLPSEREHVTFYMWKTGKFRTYRVDCEHDYSDFRFTIDYPADFEVFKAILTKLYPAKPNFSMEDLITFMEKNPEVRALQDGIVRNAGWNSAFEKDKLLHPNRQGD